MKHSRSMIIAVIVIILDRIAKFFASRLTAPIPMGFFRLSLVRNTGAGFGILQGQRFLLTIVSLIVLAYLFWKWNTFEDKFYIPLGLLVGGIAGNLIDRLAFGSVIDFIDLGWWPVFNIADSCLVISIVWIIVAELIEKKAGHNL